MNRLNRQRLQIPRALVAACALSGVLAVMPLGGAMAQTKSFSTKAMTPQAAATTEVQVQPRFTPSLHVSEASPRIKALLQTLQTDAVRKHWTFEIAYTPALDRPLSELTGLEVPANYQTIALEQNRLAIKALEFDRHYLLEKNIAPRRPTCRASDANCSYQPIMTAVRDQRGCGSCWDFAAMGAFEGAYRLRFGKVIDVAEQHILSCSGAGTCKGGWWDKVYSWMMGNTVRTEAQMPYSATDGTCQLQPVGIYKVAAYGFVTTKANIPSVAALKEALATYGPLAIGVRVTPAFQAYVRGTFNEENTEAVNHGVTLVGWDDSKGAWRIRNSWGTGWGEQGYMWIKYGSNSVGYAATWVTPGPADVALNAALLEALRTDRISATVRP